MSRVQSWSTHWNILAPKIIIFPPILIIIFIAIILFWPCSAHYDSCCFAKIIWRRPMGSIRWSSDCGSGSTEDVDFTRCVHGREPQLHKMWCLGSNNVTYKIYLTAQLELAAETVWQVTTTYLAENGLRIPTINQLYINGSVQLLGILNFSETVYWGVTIIWGVPIKVTTLSPIRGPIVAVMIKRVQLLNNFCFKSLLLGSATFLLFPSLARVPFFG